MEDKVPSWSETIGPKTSSFRFMTTSRLAGRGKDYAVVRRYLSVGSFIGKYPSQP